MPDTTPRDKWALFPLRDYLLLALALVLGTVGGVFRGRRPEWP